MASIGNMTVKKADNTTDITYTAVVPSAGDKSPAVWRAPGGTAPAHKPEFAISSQWNGPKTARRLTARFVFPFVVVGTDGKSTIADKAIFDGSWLVPQGMAETDINEFAAQIGKICGHSQVVTSVQQGYSPT